MKKGLISTVVDIKPCLVAGMIPLAIAACSGNSSSSGSSDEAEAAKVTEKESNVDASVLAQLKSIAQVEISDADALLIQKVPVPSTANSPLTRGVASQSDDGVLHSSLVASLPSKDLVAAAPAQLLQQKLFKLVGANTQAVVHRGKSGKPVQLTIDAKKIQSLEKGKFAAVHYGKIGDDNQKEQHPVITRKSDNKAWLLPKGHAAHRNMQRAGTNTYVWGHYSSNSNIYQLKLSDTGSPAVKKIIDGVSYSESNSKGIVVFHKNGFMFAYRNGKVKKINVCDDANGPYQGFDGESFYCEKRNSDRLVKFKVNPQTLIATTNKTILNVKLATSDNVVETRDSIGTGGFGFRYSRFQKIIHNNQYYLVEKFFNINNEMLLVNVMQFETQYRRKIYGYLKNNTLLTFQCYTDRSARRQRCDLIQWNLKTDKVSKIKSLDFLQKYRDPQLYIKGKIAIFYGLNENTGVKEEGYLQLTPPYNLILKPPPPTVVDEDVQLTPLN